MTDQTSTVTKRVFEDKYEILLDQREINIRQCHLITEEDGTVISKTYVRGRILKPYKINEAGEKIPCKESKEEIKKILNDFIKSL